MFPAWPASGPESNASRTPAHSFSAPAGQNLPFTFSSRSCQSVNRQMLFLQLRFPRRENTRCIFFQHPKPSFPAWPANTSRCKSYYNLQQDNSFHSGASRPIPPATILFIPALQSSISQLPSSRLGRPTPYIPSHHFFNIYKAPSSRRISAISISPLRPSTHLPFSIFYIGVNILPAFAFPYLHPTTLPTSSISFVLLPLLKPAGQTRNVVSRAGAACKAADGAGEEPAFLFFFFLLSLFLFSSLFFSISLAPRLRRDAFIFLFIFSFYFFLSFCFCSYFCSYFCFFLFAFIFAFFFLLFSIYFSSDFLFLFFLCSFFLLFLSFYFCSYLCFFVFYFYFCFTFIFAFFIFSLCFSS